MKNTRSNMAIALLGMLLSCGIVSAQNEKTTAHFQRLNEEINKDVKDILAERSLIRSLETKTKKDERKGMVYAMAFDKKKLKKAESDLRKSKAYLKADKRYFSEDYKLTLEDMKTKIRLDKSELKHDKILLNKSICKKDAAAITENADKVTFDQERLKSDMKAYESEKADRKADLILVNNETKRSREERSAVKAVKTAYTNAKTGVKGWFKRSDRLRSEKSKDENDFNIMEDQGVW